MAHQVAATTAQLVAASRAQADPSSEAQKKLSAAAKAVAAATSQLVEAVKQISELARVEREMPANRRYTMSLSAKADLEKQIEILRLEKQLQEARDELLAGRKAQYKAK